MLPRTKIIIAGIIIFAAIITIDQVRRNSSPDDEMLISQDGVKAESQPSSDWKEFTPTTGKFSVMLPSLPQHASEVVPLPENQGFIKYDMYLAHVQGSATFMISMIQYPPQVKPSGPYELLEDVMKEMLSANVNNKLKSSQKTEFKNSPAYDFVIENNDVTIKSKTFLLGKTLFVLTAIDKDAKRLEQEFEKFSDSFQNKDGSEASPEALPNTASSESLPETK